jgi:photosystem II stability/assembly factor-like uncharacterized protein
MKKKNYFVFIAIISLFLTSLSVSAQKKGKSRYVPRTDSEQTAAFGFTGALDYYKALRNNHETGEFHIEDYYAARQEVEALGTNKNTTITWRSIGPTDQGGRVRGLIFDKNNSETMYAGAVSGGLWKTTNGGQSWQAINDLMQNLIISCIDQAPDGKIYFGTGEGFAPSFGSTAGSTGFVGMGLFRSTDATGNSFEHIASTTPSSTNGWEYVYKLKVHPNGDIYAATNRGIKYSSDNGATWSNPLAALPGTATVEAHDVDISPNGNTISLVVGKKVYISTDGGANFTNVSTGGSMLPATQVSRIEVDIAPSNNNYIYACAARLGTEQLFNIYRSTDAGQSWTIIGPGGSANFQPLGTQGYFDNVIRVHPTNPNKVYVGGLDMWTWESGGNWEQKSLWYLSEFSPFYLHADHHEYVFDPNNPNIMYFGTDGGVSKSTNGGSTFESVNRNFATLQSYHMSVSKEGMIMTGTQDNGTLLMDRKGFVEGRSEPLLGGDGGYSAFSFLNDELLFGSLYYGHVQRTPVGNASGMSYFYDWFVESLGFDEAQFSQGFASFVTPLLLHEKIDDYLSPDSVKYTHVGDTVWAGDTIIAYSNTSNYPFEYILPSSVPFMVEDDELMLHDIVTAKFYVGLNGKIIMTREAHRFDKTPEWWQIAEISGMTQSMSVSKCGNYMFIGTRTGNLYRISNLDYANDLLSASMFVFDTIVSGANTSYVSSPNPFSVVEVKQLTISSSGRPVNNIAIDPNNPDRVIVVLGSYGSNLNYVFYSSNALSATPSFTSKQGTLPKVPVYSALFEMNSPNTVLVGTEYGVYMTSNITAPAPSWNEENADGIARVPVYDLKQQVFWLPGVTNYGMVYAATHGRGVFETSNFVSVPEIESTPVSKSLLEVYPNPTSDEITIKLPAGQNVKHVKIYNISGKEVMSFNLDNTITDTKTINVVSLPDGVYFIELTGNQMRQTGKFIKLQ